MLHKITANNHTTVSRFHCNFEFLFLFLYLFYILNSLFCAFCIYLYLNLSRFCCNTCIVPIKAYPK